MDVKNKSFKNMDFVSFYLAVFPILSAYEYPFLFINVGMTIFTLFAIVQVYKTKHMKINKWLLGYFIYFSILNVYLVAKGWLFVNSGIGQVLQIFAVIVILGTYGQDINISSTYKWMKRIGIILMMGLFWQAIQIYVFGGKVNPITILPISNSANWAMNLSRPMSFFQEPQLYASYFIIVLILNIKEKDFLYAFLTTVSIGLCGSSMGIVLTVMVWAFYFLVDKSIKKSIKMTTLVLVCLLVFAFFKLDIFTAARNKILTIGQSTSDYLRLFKALDTYVKLPFGYKVFGIGRGTMSAFMSVYGIELEWNVINATESYLNYLTTGFGILVESGIIGGFFYYMYFLTYVIKSKGKTTNYILLLCIFASLFTSTFGFNTLFLFYCLLLENMQDTTNNISFKL